MDLPPVELTTGGQIYKKNLRYIFLKNQKINNKKIKKTPTSNVPGRRHYLHKNFPSPLSTAQAHHHLRSFALSGSLSSSAA